MLEIFPYVFSLRLKKQLHWSILLAAFRYHSKSQADLHNQSYDDSSLTRDKSDHDPEQKAFSYATLPRKKRAVSAPQQPAVPVKGPDTKAMEDMWKNGTDLGKEKVAADLIFQFTKFSACKHFVHT